MLKGFFRVPQEFEYNHCKDYFSMKQAHDLLFKGTLNTNDLCRKNRKLMNSIVFLEYRNKNSINIS